MPSDVLVALVACTVATWVPGVPLALLALRRSSASATVALVAAAGLGLGVWMAVGLAAVHQGWFSPGPLVGVVTLIAALAWVPARRHVGMLRAGRPGWLAAVLCVLGAVGIALRSSPIYFAYQVADFGEYVNRGNGIAAGGPFGGWFVNGFPVVLGEASLLLGQARSTEVMPFLGLLIAASVLSAVHLAGVGRPVVAAAAVPLLLQVHAVWFSQFPASETLYAALLTASLLLAAASLVGRDHLAAALAGTFGFLLVVTRGNGLVYLPVVFVGLVLVPVFTDRSRSSTLRTYLAVLAGGLWLGSVYDARHNGRYFLDAQAVPRLPGPVAEVFGRLGELRIAALATVVVALGIAAAAGAGVLLERIHRRPAILRALRLGSLGVVVLGAFVAHIAVFEPQRYLTRYEGLGAPVWAAAALAVGVWFADAPSDGVRRFLIGWPLLVGVTMATFQVTRMRKSLTVDSTWFLYWDRYFFSEAFPMLLLAGAVAGGVLLTRADARGAWARRATLGAGALLVVVFVVDIVPPTLHADEQAMFEDTYAELAAIDALMPEPFPVVYDGLVERPEGWFWSNSSRVLGNPLSETFKRPVLNLAAPVGPDPRPTTDEIVRLLRDAGTDHGYLVQVRPAPDWSPVDAELDPEVLGEVVVVIERLEGRSALRPEDQPWITTTLHVRVVRVTAGRSATVGSDRDGAASVQGP